MTQYGIYWNKTIGKTVLHCTSCGHYKKHLGKWNRTVNGGWYEDLLSEDAKFLPSQLKAKHPRWDHYSCANCLPQLRH